MQLCAACCHLVASGLSISPKGFFSGAILSSFSYCSLDSIVTGVSYIKAKSFSLNNFLRWSHNLFLFDLLKTHVLWTDGCSPLGSLSYPRMLCCVGDPMKFLSTVGTDVASGFHIFVLLLKIPYVTLIILMYTNFISLIFPTMLSCC